MMKRFGKYGLLLLFACTLCGVVSAVGGLKLFSGLLNDTQVIGDRANAFMVALRENRLNDAYAMLTPELQEKQSIVNFREAFTGNSIKDWKFSNFSITNNLGYVAGMATDDEGNHFVAFQLVNQQGKWAIIGYNLGTSGWIGTVVDQAQYY
jgi:hypothetical protein